MRSLVVTTGAEQFLMNTWLPSLREKAKYTGDVLIVDYHESRNYDGGNIADLDIIKSILKSFSAKATEYLKSQPNIIYRKVNNRYPCLPSDRINAFHQVLTNANLWGKYDVFLFTDGNDIEFLQSIQALLETAAKELCAVSERLANRTISDWPIIRSGRFPRIYWETIKDQPMFNAGVIAGPPSEIKRLFEFMLQNMERYGAIFGSEQLSLNIYHYCLRNHLRDVGNKYMGYIYGDMAASLFYTVKGKPPTIIVGGVNSSHIKKYYLSKLEISDLEDLTIIEDNGKIETKVAILHMHQSKKQEFFFFTHSCHPVFFDCSAHSARLTFSMRWVRKPPSPLNMNLEDGVIDERVLHVYTGQGIVPVSASSNLFHRQNVSKLLNSFLIINRVYYKPSFPYSQNCVTPEAWKKLDATVEKELKIAALEAEIQQQKKRIAELKKLR